MATPQSHRRLSIGDLGWSFSTTLVVLFIFCMLAALFLPLCPGSWVNLLALSWHCDRAPKCPLLPGKRT